jgi:hypothetical protein
MTRGVYIAPLGTLEGMALYVSARRPSGSARESGSLQQLRSDRPTRDDTRSRSSSPLWAGQWTKFYGPEMHQ